MDEAWRAADRGVHEARCDSVYCMAPCPPASSHPLRPSPVVLAIDGATRGRIMRWGLVLSSGSSSYPLINATVGKLETGCPWKFPWRIGRRRLFTMAGFSEPHILPGGCNQPFGVRCGVGPMFGVADTLWRRRGAGPKRCRAS